MKAWKVWDDEYYNGTWVLFAETRGKAHAMAMRHEAFENCEWNDIRVKRCPEMDEMWNGRTLMDWDNPLDRIALVKHGWHCLYEYEAQARGECLECPASKWCEWYQDYLDEMDIRRDVGKWNREP